MDREITHYAVMGVDEGAGVDEIKHAHRRLVLQNHPDKLHHLTDEFPWVEEEAAERFKKITEAFHVLSDERARARYDQELKRIRRSSAPRTNHSAVVANTRSSEPTDEPFFRHPVEPRPASGFEPRAPRTRKNFFASALAFSAMVTIAYVALNSTLPDEAHAMQAIESALGITVTSSAGPALPDDRVENYAYQNPDVRYLRTLFTDYLFTRNLPTAASSHQKEFLLLERWDDTYYKSKFIVVSLDAATVGISEIRLIFRDRPDCVFRASVYRRIDGALDLRQFEAVPATPQEMETFRAQWAARLDDDKHAL